MLSFHDLTVASYLQVGRAIAGVLDAGAAHCEAAGVDPAELLDARLHPDMADFRFQVVSVAHHSLGAARAFLSGAFAPPSGHEGLGYAELQGLLADTIEGLEALDPDAIDASADGRVIFRVGEREIPFATRYFAVSFSLPNFHFHATTTYALLRARGVPLGKRDYLGQLRFGL